MKVTFSKCGLLPLVVLLAGAASGTAVLAQSQSPATQSPYDPTVAQRKENQQDRIANGVKNGTMAPGQAAHVEKQEQHIENQEKADMAAHNGHLTKREQKQLNREQNHTSKEIYKDKHSAK